MRTAVVVKIFIAFNVQPRTGVNLRFGHGRNFETNVLETSSVTF